MFLPPTVMGAIAVHSTLEEACTLATCRALDQSVERRMKDISCWKSFCGVGRNEFETVVRVGGERLLPCVRRLCGCNSDILQFMLDIMASTNSVGMARALLMYIIDNPNVHIEPCDPFITACCNGNAEIVALLIPHVRDSNPRFEMMKLHPVACEGFRVAYYNASLFAEIEFHKQSGHGSLRVACKQKYLMTMRTLMKPIEEGGAGLSNEDVRPIIKPQYDGHILERLIEFIRDGVDVP